MGAHRYDGPLCRYQLFTQIDSGTLCRNTSPTPGPVGGLSLWPELYEPGFLPAAFGMDEAITAADKAEFEIIKTMPVYDSHRRPYKTVNSYVSDRTRYFGSPSTYSAFASESDGELSNTKWVHKKHVRTLRSMVEFNGHTQKQDIFYRWVRKAYKLKYGINTNVPELIRKGMSEELAKMIAAVRGSIRVKKIHEEQFKAGGFNPRPVKYNHHYLLGTLSEHATGMAVDIEDGQNAQLTTEEWKFIGDLVGKQVIRSGRWDTEAHAESLWKDIKAVNDLFVAKIASEIQRIQKERADKEKAAAEKAAAEKAKAEKTEKGNAKGSNSTNHHSTKSARVVTPLEEVLGKHFQSLSPWATKGFFQLPLELVLELHGQGFTWGATFSTNVDLHHFELDG